VPGDVKISPKREFVTRIMSTSRRPSTMGASTAGAISLAMGEPSEGTPRHRALRLGPAPVGGTHAQGNPEIAKYAITDIRDRVRQRRRLASE